MLQIKNLTVSSGSKKILENIELEINENEIHVLMGPNGAGKSTLCKSILAHPSLKKEGIITFNGKDILNEKTDKIAKEGIYYIAQSPMEIEGVKNTELIRTALKEKNEPMDIFTFNKEYKNYAEILKIPKDFIHREVNVNMSGGEKKKNELLTMLFLKPKLILLDEIDSGLDVDAVKVVAKVLKEYQRQTKCAIMLLRMVIKN